MYKIKLNQRKLIGYCMLPIMLLFTFQPAFAESRQFSEIAHDINLKFNITQDSFRYSGYYWDPETNNDYLNARYYSPELMSFISRDTYDLANRYAYCGGDPLSNTDTTGHSFGSVLGDAAKWTYKNLIPHTKDGLIAFGAGMLIGGGAGLMLSSCDLGAVGIGLISGGIGAAGGDLAIDIHEGCKPNWRDIGIGTAEGAVFGAILAAKISDIDIGSFKTSKLKLNDSDLPNNMQSFEKKLESAKTADPAAPPKPSCLCRAPRWLDHQQESAVITKENQDRHIDGIIRRAIRRSRRPKINPLARLNFFDRTSPICRLKNGMFKNIRILNNVYDTEGKYGSS